MKLLLLLPAVLVLVSTSCRHSESVDLSRFERRWETQESPKEAARRAKEDSAKWDRIPARFYSESEIERYHDTIHPYVPRGGILTGHVIAYGYYIPPPFELSVRHDTLLLNGVEVFPKRKLKPWKPDPAVIESLRHDVGLQRLHRLEKTAGCALRARDSLKATPVGVLTRDLIDRAVSAIPIVDSIRFGKNSAWAYGSHPKTGEVIVGRFEVFGRREYKPTGRVVTQMDLVRMEKRHIEKLLRDDGGIIVGHAGTGSNVGYGVAKDIARLLLTPGFAELTDEDRWRRLYAIDLSVAFDVAANLELARPSWEKAALRYGLKPRRRRRRPASSRYKSEQ